MNVQARIEQTTGKIRKFYQTSPTQVVPIPTISVRCTVCGGVKILTLNPEAVGFYTPNGDGTYTAPWKLCVGCAEYDRSDRWMNLKELGIVVLVVMLLLLSFILIIIVKGPMGG